MLYTLKKNWKTIVIIVVAIAFVVGIILFDKFTTKYRYLTCTYENETYKEKMVFQFYEGILIEFTRDEIATTTIANEDSLYEKYIGKIKGIENDKYFQYTVDKETGYIKAHTYIYLPMKSDIFNDFFPDDYEIVRSTSLEKIKEVFDNKSYSCSVS